MIPTRAPFLRVVLYEGTGARTLEPGLRSEVMRLLLENGYPVARVRADGEVAGSGLGQTLVLGQFEQPQAMQAEPAGEREAVFLRDVTGLDAGGILKLVDAIRDEAQMPRPGVWKPWFPVIDYNRCTNCMQCLSFCLFDVYGVTQDGKIQVQKQSNCKTDCPACSRVCPEVAILFPKYRGGPINGDEVNTEDVRREAMKVDISALLGGDIYQMLRDRSAKAKSRFSKERDENRALQERQRCLAKLKDQLDIPAEVLAALPSADQILAKAEQARLRGEEAAARAQEIGGTRS